MSGRYKRLRRHHRLTMAALFLVITPAIYLFGLLVLPFFFACSVFVCLAVEIADEMRQEKDLIENYWAKAKTEQPRVLP